jgi:MOSC domain-containing protein
LMSNLVPERGSGVGRVSQLWRYPVKSMAAEPLDRAQLSWAGVTGDRRWAFVRAGAEQDGFPWHTIRNHPLMCRYTASLVDPARPDKSDVDVQTPNGDTFPVHDPALAAELGSGVRVMRMDRGIFDAMPVSLITMPTVCALSALAQVPGDQRRFRPNVVIDSTEGRPFAEDKWVGSVLHIGEVIVRVDARDGRCVVVNVNPDFGHADAPLLKVIGELRQARAGVYGTIVRPGLIQIGDDVRVAD